MRESDADENRGLKTGAPGTHVLDFCRPTADEAATALFSSAHAAGWPTADAGTLLRPTDRALLEQSEVKVQRHSSGIASRSCLR